MDINFEREQRWWDAKAVDEEIDRNDEPINRALRWREIERHLDGVKTVLDIGGGTGAFSIPLAKRGFEVTHLDLSPEMLKLAKEKAKGLDPIRFVQGNAADLSSFDDASFDLVLNMDGAVSFCGQAADQAITESCRVARRTVILAVSHRAWMAAVWAEASLGAAGRVLPAVTEMFDSGRWHPEQFADNAIMCKGCTQDYFSPFRAYDPGELRARLEAAGMRVTRCGGLGTLANFCGQDIVAKVQADARLAESFLDLCERFDHEVLPDGPGTRQRAGLIGVAKRGTS